MWGIKRRILRYAQANDKLPPDLSVLPQMANYGNEIVDYWGHPIHFTVKDDWVTLTSFGSDGKAGGNGDAADLIGRFGTKREDGSWSDEFVPWHDDPCPWHHDPNMVNRTRSPATGTR
jgi:hypothetical protein